jgi:hypothetical protein
MRSNLQKCEAAMLAAVVRMAKQTERCHVRYAASIVKAANKCAAESKRAIERYQKAKANF